jgi:LysM repeat protein
MARSRAPWAAWRPLRKSGGSITGSARKITLHTMECGSPSQDCWPGYSNGGSTPHLSLNPGTGHARQHIDFNRSAYALASPGAPRSPNMNAGINIQIEIVGRAKDTAGYSDAWYKQLAYWVNWLCDEWGVPKQFVGDFGGPNGYGTGGAYRLSWSKFQGASGIVGHSNVPFNSHWDPGNLQQAKLLGYMKGGGGSKPKPPTPSGTHIVRAGETLSGIAKKYGTTWQRLAQINGLKDANKIKPGQRIKVVGAPPPPKPPSNPWKSGDVYQNRLRYGVTNSDSVRRLQQRLIDMGYKIPAGPTGNYFGQTQAAVRQLQRDWRQAPQYATGRSLGPKQTARLFRNTPYRVR